MTLVPLPITSPTYMYQGFEAVGTVVAGDDVGVLAVGRPDCEPLMSEPDTSLAVTGTGQSGTDD